MKKLALLAMAGISLAFIAATCVIKGATVTVIDGDVWYAAEMENETQADILKHKFAVGFIEGRNAVATKTVDGCLRSLQGGASDFFSASSGRVKNDVDTAVSRLVGPITFGKVVNGDIAFSNVVVTRNGKLLRVTGKITNNDNDDLDDARVCVVVRNADGDITVTKRDNDTYNLNSNGAAYFSVDVTVPDDSSHVKKVDLWTDATNADEGGGVTAPESKLANSVTTCAATATPTKTKTNTPTPRGPQKKTPSNSPIPGTATPTHTAVPAIATPPTAC
jgi:hypothetical protein